MSGPKRPRPDVLTGRKLGQDLTRACEPRIDRHVNLGQRRESRDAEQQGKRDN
jgi:hypothetical protein